MPPLIAEVRRGSSLTRLYAGLLAKAVLDRLRKLGRFRMPKSSLQAIRQTGGPVVARQRVHSRLVSGGSAEGYTDYPALA